MSLGVPCFFGTVVVVLAVLAKRALSVAIGLRCSSFALRGWQSQSWPCLRWSTTPALMNVFP
jgi:hypothetical protein